MSRVIIDRFEEKYAVCEKPDKTIINIPRYKVPLEAREGDFLEDVNGFYVVMKDETMSKKRYLKTLMSNLKKK